MKEHKYKGAEQFMEAMCFAFVGIDQSGSIFSAESWDFKNVVKLHSRIWYVTYLIKSQPVAPVKDSAVSPQKSDDLNHKQPSASSRT